ncbi:3-hydroxyacyl-ACP dehydratase FabZ family protein [Arthrospiribacter ruber]|jgi:3-hydroxyacyl-[acyl-carrier-protein] dehydratase|uniref:Beta-hydroxyacyl-ACP dehydratase n=1 Tax=Arthrospiribacter ruber TaxID=2487934 RepID=A0A951M7M2_9BACT|nr:beta-hydroxyacyl-ACP dehydratase [Arthrospiribacter ruber]MBW3466946.1 beta-hydroxyacyl-ACP dehydratase [Arthrospiribacter ruber]
MKPEKIKIAELIPHREPFLFVEDILSANEDEIIGIKTFDKGDDWLRGSFPGSGIVPGMILLESMAQCGGAGIKLMELADGIFALTTIEYLTFYAAAEFDQEIKYVIQNLRISRSLIRQSGIAYMNGTKLFEAKWMSVKVA